MRRLIIATITILGPAVFLLATAPSSATADRKVYTMDISGDVTPGMTAFVKRVLDEIPEKEDNIIIIRMDTFGGQVDAAFMIVDLIVNTTKGETIAFVTRKAISAGALIALACDRLAMRPNTTIGDCAPITIGSEGPQMLGEKFQSPLRAKFRSLAKKNGYPEALAESMVTKEIEVFEVTMNGETIYMDARTFSELDETEQAAVTSKRTVVAKGELLTMDDLEAEAFGFSVMTVDSIEELLAGLGIDEFELIHMEQSWSEGLLRFIGSIAPLLLLIGLGALYTEVKAPGFGVPGIIGIIALSLFLINQYTVGLADYVELLIIVLGLVLIGFELFVIPGFGFAGIAGGVFILIGLVLSLQGFVLPDPTMPWQMDLMITNLTQVLGAGVGAVLIGLFMLRYVLPAFSGVIKGPYLDTTLKDFHADSTELGDVAAGDRGVAATALRPSGKAKINHMVYDVVTEGQFLEKGTPVIVSAIRGNILIVSREAAS